MKISVNSQRVTAMLLAGTVAFAPAIASRAEAADPGTIAIGTTLPLTGPLAPFGPILKLGYERAVDEVNAKGGILIGKDRKKVELTVLDSQSQPTLAAQQARTLIDEDGAVALLGSVTPPLVIPVSAVAESKHVPLVNTLTPVQAWAAGNARGWTYAWDIFFAEDKMTELEYESADLVKTNKRVALFTDNEQDGAVMGDLWAAKAPKHGYTIAYRATFPVGTSDYGSFIAEAKKAGASIVIAQMIPPDAFALWKQMKSLGFAPTLAYCEKCGDTPAWQKQLGAIGNGTMAAGWWSPSLGYPQTAAFVAAYQKTLGNTVDLGSVVASYSAARVLLDAIASAGSTDPAAIDAAIGKTNALLPFGRIRFNDKHQSTVESVMLQWQGDAMPQVYPKRGSATSAVIPLGLK